jgi:hypothetical protein
MLLDYACTKAINCYISGDEVVVAGTAGDGGCYLSSIIISYL